MKIIKLSTIIHTCEVLIEIFVLELALIEIGTDIRTLIGFYLMVGYCSIGVCDHFLSKVDLRICFFFLINVGFDKSFIQ